MTTATHTLTVAFVVKLIAKEEKAEEVGAFLAGAASLANEEAGTIVWFAPRTDPTTFWIVDAFSSQADRQAHIEGPIDETLIANADRVLATPPQTLPTHVLA